MCIITFFIITKLWFIFRAAVRFIIWWLNSHFCVRASHFQLCSRASTDDLPIILIIQWSFSLWTWKLFVVKLCSSLFPRAAKRCLQFGAVIRQTVQNPKSLAKAANADICESAWNQTVALMVQFNVGQHFSVPATSSAFSIRSKFSEVNQRNTPCILDFIFFLQSWSRRKIPVDYKSNRRGRISVITPECLSAEHVLLTADC